MSQWRRCPCPLVRVFHGGCLREMVSLEHRDPRVPSPKDSKVATEAQRSGALQAAPAPMEETPSEAGEVPEAEVGMLIMASMRDREESVVGAVRQRAARAVQEARLGTVATHPRLGFREERVGRAATQQVVLVE